MDFFYGKIAAVLSEFGDEHGLPNALGVSELAQLLRAPSEAACRMALGRIIRNNRVALNHALVDVGITITGYYRSTTGSHMAVAIDRLDLN